METDGFHLLVIELVSYDPLCHSGHLNWLPLSDLDLQINSTYPDLHSAACCLVKCSPSFPLDRRKVFPL